MVDAPTAGRHYPRSYGQVRAWFATDADCLDYLDWLRWPEGFVCPACANTAGWRIGDGRWMCARCSKRVSPTAGTVFEGHGAGHRRPDPNISWLLRLYG